eukprot:2224019-Pyramimonas_sp.AAC.1
MALSVSCFIQLYVGGVPLVVRLAGIASAMACRACWFSCCAWSERRMTRSGFGASERRRRKCPRTLGFLDGSGSCSTLMGAALCWRRPERGRRRRAPTAWQSS